jgi:hypothetical protein
MPQPDPRAYSTPGPRLAQSINHHHLCVCIYMHALLFLTQWAMFLYYIYILRAPASELINHPFLCTVERTIANLLQVPTQADLLLRPSQ